MKVTFNAKKDAFYNIFVQGIITRFAAEAKVTVVDGDGVIIGYQTYSGVSHPTVVQMNMMIRSQWEGLTTLWLELEGATWYFSRTETPNITVRQV